MDLTDNDLEQQIKAAYHHILQETTQIEIKKPFDNNEKIIEKIKIIEEFSNFKNRYYALFSHTEFYPIYVSKNVTGLGYSQEEFYRSSLIDVLKAVYWKQLPLALKVHQWGRRFRKLAGANTTLTHEVFYCGIRIKNKYNQLRVFSIKQKFLKVNHKGEPILSFLEAEDISAIFKGDFVWMRNISNHASIPVTRVFFNKGSKKEYPELLTKRELEILQLIMENKDSNQIAELLSISRETVKRHRKNMIARGGAKDMTALIYICRLCNLV